MSLVNYVHCERVIICKDFPNKCSPLCDAFLGFACVGKNDKMDLSCNRNISHEQLLENSQRYLEVSGDY